MAIDMDVELRAIIDMEEERNGAIEEGLDEELNASISN